MGNRNLSVPPDADPSAIRTIGKIDLNLKSNGRFELLEGGAPKTGRYRTSGDTAYLKVETFFERPIETQGKAAVDANVEIEAKLQSDGTLRFHDPKGYDPDPIVLKREAQPVP